MSEVTADVQRIFSSIADHYDRLNTLLTLNVDQRWRELAVKVCAIKENDSVLDLCCGTGKMIELECRAVGENAEVIGLDFNNDMLAVGARRLEKMPENHNYRLVLGDATQLPFKDNTFHCVTIAFGLRNIPDKRRAVSEIYRVVKPGGKVVCLELSRPEIPVLKKIYDLYFGYAMPIIGYLGTRDKAAYRYLRDSVNGFMTKEELRDEFGIAGFENPGFDSLSFGIASIHYGIKPL